jgi:Tfp pilus assembly protein PilV
VNSTPHSSPFPPATPIRHPAPRGLRGRGLRGFTILEVAMASFVMLLGIASSIIAMQSGFKQIDVSRGTTIASQIIQSEMERLRMMPWNKTSPASTIDSISELPASEEFDGATYFSANPQIAGKFTITRTVEDDPARTGNVRNITVRVRWQSYDNRWHQRSFTAIYARNGLYDYYYTVAHP